MNFSRPTTVIMAAIVVVCALAAVTEGASRGSWKNNAKIQEYLDKNPAARRMTQGPIGGIIDILIDIILILLSIVFGDSLSVINQVTGMRAEMNQMKALLGI